VFELVFEKNVELDDGVDVESVLLEDSDDTDCDVSLVVLPLVELLVTLCSVELDDEELVVKLKNVEEDEPELLDEDDTEVELLDEDDTVVELLDLVEVERDELLDKLLD